MEIQLLDADGNPLAGRHEAARPRRPRKPWTPLRRAVVAAIALGVVVMVAANAAVSIRTGQLRTDLDRDVRRELAAAIADATRGTSRGVVPGTGRADLVIQVLQSFGAEVAASPGVDPTMISVNGPFDGTAVETKSLDVDGRIEPYRVTWAAVPTPPGVASATVVVAALPMGSTEHAIDRFRAAVLVTVGVIVVVGVATYVARRRTRARRATLVDPISRPGGSSPPLAPSP